MKLSSGPQVLLFLLLTSPCAGAPDTTSELHVPAGKGPYFLAGAQALMLGLLQDTLAEVEAFVQTFWSSMRPHAEPRACGEGRRRWSVECRRCCKWRRDVRKRTRVQVRARCLTNPLHV